MITLYLPPRPPPHLSYLSYIYIILLQLALTDHNLVILKTVGHLIIPDRLGRQALVDAGEESGKEGLIILLILVRVILVLIIHL